MKWKWLNTGRAWMQFRYTSFIVSLHFPGVHQRSLEMSSTTIYLEIVSVLSTLRCTWFCPVQDLFVPLPTETKSCWIWPGLLYICLFGYLNYGKMFIMKLCHVDTMMLDLVVVLAVCLVVIISPCWSSLLRVFLVQRLLLLAQANSQRQ